MCIKVDEMANHKIVLKKIGHSIGTYVLLCDPGARTKQTLIFLASLASPQCLAKTRADSEIPRSFHTQASVHRDINPKAEQK